VCSPPTGERIAVRESLGMVARVVPFNHRFMFCAGKSAAQLTAGNAVIVEPPEHARLSSQRLAELVWHLVGAVQ
jgi:betaine-aldehyde dehydrogenase